MTKCSPSLRTIQHDAMLLGSPATRPPPRFTEGTTMSTLQQLQATCLGLLFSTQAHKVGFARLGVQEDAEVLSEKELHLLGLYDRLAEVCLERRVLEAELEGVGIDGLSLVSFFSPTFSFFFSFA